MLEIRHLYYFLAVAREENITYAAESLHISQPTLSKQLMDLENQLGKQLFIRGKRKITLTEEGLFLRSKAREMTELMEKTEAAFGDDDKPVSGDVYFGCGETYAMEYITEVFREIQSEYPDVHFHIYSGDSDGVLERLDKGLLDAGLLIGPTRQDKYEYIDINKKDRFGLLMPKNDILAEKSSISPNELKNLPLICSRQTFSGKHALNRIGIDYSALNVTATYNLIYNATFMVEAGMGYALCLDNLVNTAGRNLAFRPIIPEMSLDLYVVTKKYQTFSNAAKLFLDKLQKQSSKILCV